jgi:hypothetical protein
VFRDGFLHALTTHLHRCPGEGRIRRPELALAGMWRAIPTQAEAAWAEPEAYARSNDSATLLHVEKTETGQRIPWGLVTFRASPHQASYFSIKSTIDVAVVCNELTCCAESTSLSLNVVRTVSS